MIAAITLGMAFLSIARGMFSTWWLLAPVAVFVVLLVQHYRVVRRRTFAERGTRFCEHGIARLNDSWMGTGNQGAQFLDPAHIYSSDLDVFGRGSLFELTARARTASGEQTLAEWFRTVADRAEALLRQEAIRELTERLDLREDVALLGEDVRAEVHEARLAEWGSAAPVSFARYLRLVALLLGVAGITTLIGLLAGVVPKAPFAVVLACNLSLGYVVRKRVRHVAAAAEAPGQDLRIFSLLLERLEPERFESTRLQRLRSALDVEGWPASKRIRRLEFWLDLLDSSDHVLVRIIGPLVLWRAQMAMAVESWRRANGQHVAAWVRAVAEFEALSSLASLKFERPAWSFPLLLDGGAHFEAQALQHPLMSPAKCIPNDVSIGGSLRLLIVSGSNMSGKSTLLRSVGLNAILAWAGGPVAATEMHISPLHVGASVRVVDSLQDNRSRFFAEITRIREIVELTRSRQLIFLLDELLSGTNSHDRRIGASGIVGALVKAGAIGLITTHDLALAEIERDLEPAATNVHFDDQILDGRIEFDYRLRPGVVTHSNALELMRAIGLKV